MEFQWFRNCHGICCHATLSEKRLRSNRVFLGHRFRIATDCDFESENVRKNHFWRIRGYVSKPWQPWMFMSQNDPKCMFPQKSGELALEQNDQNLQYSIELVPSKPRVRHTQTTHPNNMIYLSPKDEWKHWLYAVILTFSFQDLGF